jgi:hypothetical protein
LEEDVGIESSSQPLVPETVIKTVVIVAALLVLLGFFVFPWVGNTGTSYQDAEAYDLQPWLYGNNAYEHVAYAPILLLVPFGAVLALTVACALLIVPRWMGEPVRRTWPYWLLILVFGVAVFYPHVWGTSTMLNLPWEGNTDMIAELVHEHHWVLGGVPRPEPGYYVSVVAASLIVISSLAGSLLRRRTKAER